MKCLKNILNWGSLVWMKTIARKKVRRRKRKNNRVLSVIILLFRWKRKK